MSSSTLRAVSDVSVWVLSPKLYFKLSRLITTNIHITGSRPRGEGKFNRKTHYCTLYELSVEGGM
jgi:hypothetical protein